MHKCRYIYNLYYAAGIQAGIQCDRSIKGVGDGNKGAHVLTASQYQVRTHCQLL